MTGAIWCGIGSSPRGRGTRARRRPVRRALRFIPARAGNAPGTTPSARRASVHPRAGGERRRGSIGAISDYGSSPRGRGTPDELHHAPETGRFIPARAGNATTHPASALSRVVHPRAGGERYDRRGRPQIFHGSSPRGRGTRIAARGHRLDGRFIPARAGNAGSPASSRSVWTVHPRAGGERSRRSVRSSPRAGSSPRGRGTLEGRPDVGA